jgi:hypothetical protein
MHGKCGSYAKPAGAKQQAVTLHYKAKKERSALLLL